jgi:diacylglycerol kinase (CTP)
MSRPYSSVNRFAALDSLDSSAGNKNPPSSKKSPAQPRPINGTSDSQPKKPKGKANGSANGPTFVNGGKEPKNRSSTESVESQPSMETTVRAAATTTRQRAKKAKQSVQSTVVDGSISKRAHDIIDTANAKIDWEIPRKSLHASIGFLVLYLYSLRPSTTWPLIRGLAATGVFIYLVDLLRFRSPAFARTYNSVLGPLMRESEKTSVNGVVWYLIGVTWTLAVYPRDIAVIAIMT